jgi:hypothetical protein
MARYLTPRRTSAFILANLALGATYFIPEGSSRSGDTAYSVLRPLLVQEAAATVCDYVCNLQTGWCVPEQTKQCQQVSGPGCENEGVC